jgi:hypothetical protein
MPYNHEIKTKNDTMYCSSAAATYDIPEALANID